MAIIIQESRQGEQNTVSRIEPVSKRDRLRGGTIRPRLSKKGKNVRKFSRLTRVSMSISRRLINKQCSEMFEHLTTLFIYGCLSYLFPLKKDFISSAASSAHTPLSTSVFGCSTSGARRRYPLFSSSAP